MKCPICGKEYNEDSSYIEKHGQCFSCKFWSEKILQDSVSEPHRVAIIDGTHYFIDDEDSESEFRGFGGSKFHIIFNDGVEVITTNLWCQGDIPEFWRPHFPDNAKFSQNLKWENINGINHLVFK